MIQIIEQLYAQYFKVIWEVIAKYNLGQTLKWPLADIGSRQLFVWIVLVDLLVVLLQVFILFCYLTIFMIDKLRHSDWTCHSCSKLTSFVYCFGFLFLYLLIRLKFVWRLWLFDSNVLICKINACNVSFKIYCCYWKNSIGLACLCILIGIWTDNC